MVRPIRSRLDGAVLAAPVLLLALLACGDLTVPGTEAASDPANRILFVSERDGATGEAGSPLGEIYRVGTDGSGVENLTGHPASYGDLRLSPDGGRLAFYSDRSGCYDLWVMDVDGSAVTQLTGVEADERCNYGPRWSPDGTKIAFYSSRDATEGRGWDAFVMNADGTGLVDVGNNPSTDPATHNDMVHGWSPDGRVVLFSTRDGRERTYLVNPDGTDLQPLLDLEGFTYPYWSPDRARILYTSQGSTSSLHVVRADGSQKVDLPQGAGDDWVSRWASNPWSPDGARIAFDSHRTGDREVLVVGADGTGLINVTSDPAADAFLGWSPDGSRIVFMSRRTGNWDVYVADADGTNPVNLTDHPANDTEGVWVPGP